MILHPNPSHHASATVTVEMGRGLESFRVEDWWDRVSGGSWMDASGNRAALKYAMRSGFSGLPLDDEVLYGKDSQNFGHLIHLSEVRA